jgi:hypothetical protein
LAKVSSVAVVAIILLEGGTPSGSAPITFQGRRVLSWPVSRRVGNVKNNDPSMIEPG